MLNYIEEIKEKYSYLMNLTPLTRRKEILPYSVVVLDRQLVEMESSLVQIKETGSKKDIADVQAKMSDIKASITLLIIGT
tara:strand:- start:5044 stop:5283 length:240 start_codon:yes stop_codon:yes gene_type:complete